MTSLSSYVIVALASATSSDATKSITLALSMLKLAPRLITSNWAGVKDFVERLWTILSAAAVVVV